MTIPSFDGPSKGISTIPIVWPIQEGTDLTQKEVTILEETMFSFDCSCA
jgi:hypothetical protein